MKKIISLFIISLFVFFSCDYLGTYTFIVKNETQETITLKFLNKSSYRDPDENKEVVILRPTDEKTVRILDAPFNVYSHDCLTNHGIAYFRELVFDTYVNGVKMEKQLWQAENWIYKKISRTSGKYNMIITDELIKE